MNEKFARDVLTGLKNYPKKLSSKYFYDAQGDKLFQEIMEMPEYYLTCSEYQILEKYHNALYHQFSSEGTVSFDLIELGAGDGTKTKILLEHFLDRNAAFTYYPVDISKNVLHELSETLQEEFPNLKVREIQKEYFDAIRTINGNAGKRKVILFLGSNIGNFDKETSDSFLRELSNALRPGDMTLIGFDLKKDPRVILSAYDDGAGITKEFNLNLLKRINSELSGDFNIQDFVHYAVYNPEDGKASSYLVSTIQQKVKILDEEIFFRDWESIQVEISQKFDQPMIEDLATKSGFEIVEKYFDERKYFVDVLWRKK